MLRAFFVVMGAATFFPSLFFLILYRSGEAPRWLARALRCLVLAVCMDGFRVFVVNLVNLDTPPRYENWLDKSVAIATVPIAALAVCVFFSVYTNLRRWTDR